MNLSFLTDEENEDLAISYRLSKLFQTYQGRNHIRVLPSTIVKMVERLEQLDLERQEASFREV